MSNHDNTRFRFSDRITLVTEHANSVIVNNAPLANEAEKVRQLDLEKERQQAYNQGWQECEEQKKQELIDIRTQIEEERGLMPRMIDDYLEQFEIQVKSEIIDLSFRIAEYILEREMANQEDYRHVMTRLLDGITANAGIKLYVNPEVATTMAAAGIKIRSGVEILPDQALRPGEVKASCGNGIIDGTFATRLTTLRDELAKHWSAEADKEKV